MLTIQQIVQLESLNTGAIETALQGLLVKGLVKQTKDSTEVVKQIRKRGQAKQTRGD